MPRARTPKNETNRAATERWRERVSAAGRSETDLVDCAIAAAVAVFGLLANEKASAPELQRFALIERMAINFLISRGKDVTHARSDVIRRIRRLDVTDLLYMVNDHQS